MLGYLQPIPEGSEEEFIAQGYDPATDRIGVAGVEASYEDVLRGQKGQQIIEEDVLGRLIRVVQEQAAPVPGDNVYLTLDLDLQRSVEEALRFGMAQPDVNSPRGVAIVMNPQTGEILALVSLPTYDNNLFVHGISASDWQRLNDDVHRPLLNHAISDGLPPGSVFKIVLAPAALQEGVLTPRTRLTCPGRVVVPNKYYPNDPGRAQPFYCWNKAGHGSLDVVGGVAHSCDIFFYKVGGGFEDTHFEGLGVSRIAQYAELFGFGEPTGVELPAEIGGLVPSRTWKRLTIGESWSTGDTYNLSIGQGYLSVTPLQMLNAVNVVANGGTLHRPRIVHHVTDAQEVVTQPFEPEIVRKLPISPEYWSLIQQGMEGAVAYGTAPRARIEGLRVAGKTGTAQFCDDIMCGVGLEQPEHAWFAAFAPVEEPQVSVIVFLYNGGEGSTAAVPVVHDILEVYFTRPDTAGPPKDPDDSS
jgi:penicillin-binding protein 2